MDMDVDTDTVSGFDLEAYISNYSGHTKVDRLFFIASQVPGTPLELEALGTAAEELRKTEDTTRYLKAHDLIGARLGPEVKPDSEWVKKMDRMATQTEEKLLQELSGHKANLVKESIRFGHNELGDFYYRRGQLQDAYKSYIRTKDYCFTPKHILTMCMNVIRVNIEMQQFVYVHNSVQKAESTPQVMEDKVTCAKIQAVAGLAALASSKYKTAARKFTAVGAELETHFDDVIAPQDIAMYGGLCALSTLDRDDLKTKLIDNVQFKEFLELVPEMRELIHSFYHSKYPACLAALQTMRAHLKLDMHMSPHVDQLCSEIRHRALIQYTTPYASLNLHAVATAFNTTLAGVEAELAALIASGKIQARIDSHSQMLHARHADARSATFVQALAAGDAYIRSSKATLLRASLVKHDLLRKPSRGGPGRAQPPRGAGTTADGMPQSPVRLQGI